MNDRDAALLYDIVLEGRKLERFLQGASRATFEADEVLQHAVLRVLTVIGEAAHRVSDGLKEAHPEVPWRPMAGMRHRLVHDYRNIRIEIVWNAAIEEVPRVLPLVEAMVPPPPEESAEGETSDP